MLRQFVKAEPPKRKRTSGAAGVTLTLEQRKEHERFAITFCEASVHAGGVGNAVTGNMAPEGLSCEELRSIKTMVESRGGVADYVSLNSALKWQPPGETWQSSVSGHEGNRSMADLEAGVLVIRNGADFLLGPGSADRLFAEQCSFPYDRMYLNSRQKKMLKKSARYNIEFGPIGQEQGFPSIGAVVPDIRDPDFEAKMAAYQELVSDYNYVNPNTGKPYRVYDSDKNKMMYPSMKGWPSFQREFHLPDPVKYFEHIHDGDCTSTVKAFGDLPGLDGIRTRLGDLSAKTDGLFAEGNHYYGPKSNINYHGDGERKIIVCLCLGKTTKLTYQWRPPEANAALKQTLAATVTANHGDIYFMSEKAGGYDWKFGRSQWPEPRLVHGAAFEQSTLDKFMENKSKRAKNKN
tara:strand:- start:1783 stop:3000 length:1218 start_codon:yes stop_codon:yes gene_type:complete